MSIWFTIVLNTLWLRNNLQRECQSSNLARLQRSSPSPFVAGATKNWLPLDIRTLDWDIETFKARESEELLPCGGVSGMNQARSFTQ